MKIFQLHELRAAYAHAAAGGQALHVCPAAPFVRVTAPQCFRQSKQFAHLFDQDHARLIATAQQLGIRTVRVEYPGTHRQHIDLCARPLMRAVARANREAEQPQLAAQRKAAPQPLGASGNQMLNSPDSGGSDESGKGERTCGVFIGTTSAALSFYQRRDRIAEKYR